MFCLMLLVLTSLSLAEEVGVEGGDRGIASIVEES